MSRSSYQVIRYVHDPFFLSFFLSYVRNRWIEEEEEEKSVISEISGHHHHRRRPITLTYCSQSGRQAGKQAGKQASRDKQGRCWGEAGKSLCGCYCVKLTVHIDNWFIMPSLGGARTVLCTSELKVREAGYDRYESYLPIYDTMTSCAEIELNVSDTHTSCFWNSNNGKKLGSMTLRNRRLLSIYSRLVGFVVVTDASCRDEPRCAGYDTVCTLWYKKLPCI